MAVVRGITVGMGKKLLIGSLSELASAEDAEVGRFPRKLSLTLRKRKGLWRAPDTFSDR